jgi:phage antirepressor YoqD-like protein
MNEVTESGSKFMTVREVADVLRVSADTIKISIRELYPDLMQNGVTTVLDEAQVTAVKMNLRKNSQVQNQPKTDLEKKLIVAQAIQFLQEEIEELRSRNEELKPKAEFFDAVADSKDALQMRDVAAALNLPGWGRNKIFAFLRKQGILDGKNIPYREFQDREYFRVIEQNYADAFGDTHISLKTLVYQKGVDFIRKLIKEGVQ